MAGILCGVCQDHPAPDHPQVGHENVDDPLDPSHPFFPRLSTLSREDQDFVFEIVAPSIPGYGFSSAPKKTGFHFGHCANVFKKLMHRLGHPVFYAQVRLFRRWGHCFCGSR